MPSQELRVNDAVLESPKGSQQWRDNRSFSERAVSEWVGRSGRGEEGSRGNKGSVTNMKIAQLIRLVTMCVCLCTWGQGKDRQCLVLLLMDDVVMDRWWVDPDGENRRWAMKSVKQRRYLPRCLPLKPWSHRSEQEHLFRAGRPSPRVTYWCVAAEREEREWFALNICWAGCRRTIKLSEFKWRWLKRGMWLSWRGKLRANDEINSTFWVDWLHWMRLLSCHRTLLLHLVLHRPSNTQVPSCSLISCLWSAVNSCQ